MTQKSFLDQEAPKGYIAGIGRGTIGFSTNADSGVNRIIIDNRQKKEKSRIIEEYSDNIKQNQTYENKEEKEINEKIANKLRKRDEKVIKHESKNQNNLKDMFCDLKRDLSMINYSEWETIPEARDMTHKNKRMRFLKQKEQRYYSLPDNIILEMGHDSESTNFHSILSAKDEILKKKLDSAIENYNMNVKKLQNVKNLPEENDVMITNGNFANVKKMRLIYASMLKTHPKKPSVWISSARLEEQSKNFTTAKSLIVQGCKLNPRNEDIWLENIRLHLTNSEDYVKSKLIVLKALQLNEKSEKLWLKAVNLEKKNDIVKKKKILFNALKSIPDSISLWDLLISLETNHSFIKKFTIKAVSLCPYNSKFWDSLFNMIEKHEIKSLIEDKKNSLRGNLVFFLNLAKLEEQENKDVKLEFLNEIINNGFNENCDFLIKWDDDNDYLKRIKCFEKNGFLKTCEALFLSIFSKTNENALKNDLNDIFDYIKILMNENLNHSANIICKYLTDKLSHDIDFWITFFSKYKDFLNIDEFLFFDFYDKAIKLNPMEDKIYLMFAEDKWKISKDIISSRNIFDTALKLFPKNENIQLARIKVEIENKDFLFLKDIFENSFEIMKSNSFQLWIEYITLMRFLVFKNLIDLSFNEVLSICDKSIEIFPEHEYFSILKTNVLLYDLNDTDAANEFVKNILKQKAHFVKMWIFSSLIEEKFLNILIKARSTLDLAISKNRDSVELWEEKINLEIRNKNVISARKIMDKALKCFPNSDVLWIQNLYLISNMTHRKNMFFKALKDTNNSSFIVIHIGVYFYMINDLEKATNWIKNGFLNEQTDGDAWGFMYFITNKHDNNNLKNNLIQNYNEQFKNIKRGKVWNSIKNNKINFDKKPKEILDLVEKKLIDIFQL